MPKVRLKVKALEDVDVQYISLVGRPANRIPFRVTKSEGTPLAEPGADDMLDLEQLVRRKTDGEQVTAAGKLAAVVLQKADLETHLENLQAQGIATDNQIEVDGVVVLKQYDFNEADVLPFQLTDTFSVLVENVKKEFQPYLESGSFKEVVSAEGFLPGVQAANDALVSTIFSILRKADNPGDVRTDLSTALTEYSNYVLTMADNLPSTAFKLDTIKEVSTTKEDQPQSENETSTEGEAPQATSQEEPTGEQVTKAEGETTAEQEQPQDETAEEASTTQKQDETPDIHTLVLTLKDELLDKLSGLSESVKGITDAQQTLTERLDAVETVAKSAQKAVKSTVLTGSSSDDGGAGSGGRKKADDLWAGSALDNLLG